MTPLKLLYVVGTFPKVSETFVANEILGLADRGHRISVAMLRRGIGDFPQHPLVRYIEPRPTALLRNLTVAGRLACPEPGESIERRLYAVAAARALEPHVAADPPDIIHAHFINRPTLVARQLGARLGIPVTFMTHASDYRVGTSPAALGERLRTAAAAMVVSDAARQHLAGMIPDPSAAFGPNVHVVRACMGRLEAPPPLPRHPSSTCEVVTVARLVPKKGIDLALRAFARLLATAPGARYRIAGDGPELGSLTALAGELGIAHRVTFLGLVPPAEARALTAGADIALLPCRVDASGDVDGIPVSLMEAGAAGIAVLSTRVSGIPELVESGYSGILTEPDDLDGLANALVRLQRDTVLRTMLGRNLRARVADEFAQDRQLTRLERIWEDAIHGRTVVPSRPPQDGLLDDGIEVQTA